MYKLASKLIEKMEQAVFQEGNNDKYNSQLILTIIHLKKLLKYW